MQGAAEAQWLKPFRVSAQVLSLLTGLAASIGGALLLAREDGSLVKLSLALLQDTPFRNYSVPGVFLLGVVGVTNLYAAFLLSQRRREGPAAAIVAGGALMAFMAVQLMYVGYLTPLQPMCVGVGVLLLFFGILLIEERRRLLHA